ERPDRIDMTGDAVSAENWFEASRALERVEEETFVGTAPVRKQRASTTTDLVKKMIAPTIALVIVGIMIGGFIAFNGEGGKGSKPTERPKPTRVAEVWPPDTPAAAQHSAEPVNAATATAGGEQPQPPAPTAVGEAKPSATTTAKEDLAAA